MFEVGKEVVVIRKHSQKPFEIGDTFVLKGIRQGCCNDCKVEVDIGIIDESYDDYMICTACGKITKSKTWWFNSTYFAPLDDISISELTEVLEKEPFEL